MTQVGQVDPEGLISLTESGALPLPASLYFASHIIMRSNNSSNVIEE